MIGMGMKGKMGGGVSRREERGLRERINLTGSSQDTVREDKKG